MYYLLFGNHFACLMNLSSQYVAGIATLLIERGSTDAIFRKNVNMSTFFTFLMKKIFFKCPFFFVFTIFVLSVCFSKFIGVNVKLILQWRLIQRKYSDRKQMNNDEVRGLEIWRQKTAVTAENCLMDRSSVKSSEAYVGGWPGWIPMDQVMK